MEYENDCYDEDREDKHYRRGYYHGYLAAIGDARKDLSLGDMEDFCQNKLYDWRYKIKKEAFPYPPVFVIKNK